jgi:hypothetical protein
MKIFSITTIQSAYCAFCRPGRAPGRASEVGNAFNTDLFDGAERAGFEIFITCDQNIAFRQNLGIRRIAIVVLMTNRWNDIRAEPQTVQHAIDSAMPGTLINVRFTLSRGSHSPAKPNIN